MALNTNCVEKQTAILRQQIGELEEIKKLLNEYSRELQFAWNSHEAKPFSGAAEHIRRECAKTAAELEEICNNIRVAVEEILAEEALAAMAAAGAGMA